MPSSSAILEEVKTVNVRKPDEYEALMSFGAHIKLNALCLSITIVGRIVFPLLDQQRLEEHQN
jgi:hypothetical protein